MKYLTLKIVAHNNAAPRGNELAMYAYDVVLSHEWLLNFQDNLTQILSAQKLPKTFIDDIITATMESYENLVRHSKGDNKIIVRILPTYIEFIFLNKGDLCTEKKIQTVHDLLESAWNYRPEDVSFGAGTFMTSLHLDEYQQTQVGEYVWTRLQKNFPFTIPTLLDEHRIPKAEKAIPFFEPFQIRIQDEILPGESGDQHQ